MGLTLGVEGPIVQPWFLKNGMHEVESILQPYGCGLEIIGNNSTWQRNDFWRSNPHVLVDLEKQNPL